MASDVDRSRRREGSRRRAATQFDGFVHMSAEVVHEVAADTPPWHRRDRRLSHRGSSTWLLRKVSSPT